MKEIKQLKALIETFISFYNIEEDITIRYSPYIYFKNDLEEFIFRNHLENTLEWKKINENLITRSNQYLSREEMDIILTNLSALKHSLLQKHFSLDEQLITMLHPKVIETSKEAFVNKLYTEAVRSAFIEIENILNKIYRQETQSEAHGQHLMRLLFKIENPLFIFNNLENETQRNDQEGYCNIFAGAMQAIRNDKAHSNDPITKEQAIKKLMLASLLFEKIDVMHKNPNYQPKQN